MFVFKTEYRKKQYLFSLNDDDNTKLSLWSKIDEISQKSVYQIFYYCGGRTTKIIMHRNDSDKVFQTNLLLWRKLDVIEFQINELTIIDIVDDKQILDRKKKNQVHYDNKKRIDKSFNELPCSHGNDELYGSTNKNTKIESTQYSVFQDDNGNTVWMYKGEYHREGDLPAVIRANGTQEWWINGKLHRDNDRPAKIMKNGHKEWFVDGNLHRDNDKPAIIRFNGSKEWFKNGQRHRENGLPAIELLNGTKEWWVDGLKHRDDEKPALEWVDGKKEWWVCGNRHRTRGPAIVTKDGEKQWFLNGVKLTEKSHHKRMMETIILTEYDDRFECRNGYGNLHSENGQPALIIKKKRQMWYFNGLLHRDDDLPAMVYNDGTKKWFKNGRPHRDNDMPAVIGTTPNNYKFKQWYFNGKLHRENGKPSIVIEKEEGVEKEWWVDGEKMDRTFEPNVLFKSEDPSKAIIEIMGYVVNIEIDEGNLFIKTKKPKQIKKE